MARVKRGVTTRAKHKNILEQAKGYYGRRKNTIRIARQAVEKARQYAYRDRKVKKRSFRGLWITAHQRRSPRRGPDLRRVHARHQAGRHRARPQGSRDLAMNEAEIFSGIIAQAQKALSEKPALPAGLSARTRRSKGARSNPGALFLGHCHQLSKICGYGIRLPLKDGLR